jgi:Leucine-rich repeat (LRR) protein
MRETNRQPTEVIRPAWFQFRLRRLLAVILVLSIGLAWLANIRHEALRQREVVAQWRTLGGTVVVEDRPPGWRPDWLDTDYLARVRRIDLGGTKAHDLQAVAKCTNLRQIYLWNTQISDLSPLSGKASLEVLDVAGTQVRNCESLRSMPNLKEVALSGLSLKDFASLSELTELEVLVAQHNGVSDLTPLATLSGLKKLSLGGNPIRNIEPLFGLTELDYLDLSQTHVSQADYERLKQAFPKCRILYSQLPK